ncbi:MAG: HDOD domain-containing protein [Thermoguttaceae bacterium]|nr:HDOD domain-containing protein [Thermoguttaceae bacterium]
MSAISVPASIAHAPLERLVRRIGEVSTLPHVALKVMEIANDPNSGAADMKRILEADAALSARVLRCVNSSAYGVRMKITNLQQAVAYLGLKQIRNLAMTAGVADMFRNDEAIGPYRRSELWRHLVSVGICARMVAMRLKFLNFEDAFLAGLLHDLGIVLEDQYAHRPFCQIVQSLAAGSSLVEVEREFLGFDHAVLGECVAQDWGFPEPVRATIGYHHAAENYRGPSTEVIRCVEIGNLLCTFKGIPSVGVKLTTGSTQVLTALSLSREDLAVLAGDLDRELALNADLFNM